MGILNEEKKIILNKENYSSVLERKKSTVVKIITLCAVIPPKSFSTRFIAKTIFWITFLKPKRAITF
jgi:hypothetical protein